MAPPEPRFCGAGNWSRTTTCLCGGEIFFRVHSRQTWQPANTFLFITSHHIYRIFRHFSLRPTASSFELLKSNYYTNSPFFPYAPQPPLPLAWTLGADSGHHALGQTPWSCIWSMYIPGPKCHCGHPSGWESQPNCNWWCQRWLTFVNYDFNFRYFSQDWIEFNCVLIKFANVNPLVNRLYLSQSI